MGRVSDIGSDKPLPSLLVGIAIHPAGRIPATPPRLVAHATLAARVQVLSEGEPAELPRGTALTVPPSRARLVRGGVAQRGGSDRCWARPPRVEGARFLRQVEDESLHADKGTMGVMTQRMIKDGAKSCDRKGLRERGVLKLLKRCSFVPTPGSIGGAFGPTTRSQRPSVVGGIPLHHRPSWGQGLHSFTHVQSVVVNAKNQKGAAPFIKIKAKDTRSSVPK